MGTKDNSDKKETVEIPSGEYANKTLEINAPNADVVNSGKFQKVVIEAIAESTYTEKADNTIDFNANAGRVIVEEGGAATINLGEVEKVFHLENNGIVRDVTVSRKTSLSLGGSNVIPVTLASGAENSSITTSAELRITASAKWGMTMLPGSEHSKATVTDKEHIPSVDGVGCLPVTVSSVDSAGETKDVVNVLAKMKGHPDINKSVTVTGKASEWKLADSGDVDKIIEKVDSVDATVYILEYAAQTITADNYSGHIGNAVKSTTTDKDGNYTFRGKSGPL